MTATFPYLDPTLQKQLNKRDAVFSHYNEAKLEVLRNTLLAVYGNARKANSKVRISPSLLAHIRIQTDKASSIITAQFVHFPIEVYNGKRFHVLLVTPDIVGYPLSAFVPTRFTKYTFKNKKKQKKRTT